VEILFRFKSLCEANLAELTALVVKEIACRCHCFECVMKRQHEDNMNALVGFLARSTARTAERQKQKC